MRSRSFAVRWLCSVAVACAAMPGGPAAAQQYPEKPIRLVVPWPAGGGSDVVARRVAEPLGEQIGQQVVVDNRPGANGAIGSTMVAQAPKDGYTLVWVTADTHAMNPHVYPKLQYQLRDFAPVGIAGYFPYALFVNPAFPANDVAEFVKQAKAQPGKITFGSWGIGGSAHVAMEMFEQQAGFDVLHVPFQGAAPAIQAVVAGHVDSMIVPLSAGGPQAKAGRLKMLGLAAPKRFAGAPDLKTFQEQGVPLDAGTWVGIMAPAGTPREILLKLNQALNTVIARPEVREALLSMNVDPSSMSVDEFGAFLKSEHERYGTTIRNANIKAGS